MRWIAALFLIGMPVIVLPADPHTVTKADVERWMTELSNWGRWGKEDQLGALNLVTSATRKRAAELVHEGVSVSLARDTEKEKAIDNQEPFKQEMNWTGQNTPGQFALDTYTVLYHGYAHTHMDALCHMFYHGKMYNGFAQDLVTKDGAGKLAITNVKQGIFTRGILIDVPRLKGLKYLEPKTPIYPEDLDRWEKLAGVKSWGRRCRVLPDWPVGEARRKGPLGCGE